MKPVADARWDDFALAMLLLITSVPRAVLAVFYDRPLGVEGTLSLVAVACALLLLISRRRS
jgi:hypothetical protein